jgi:hypothetical protein
MDRKTLESALVAGQQAWPGVELDAEVFGRHLSRVVGASPERAWLANAADLYLACAYLLGRAGAREALEQRFRPELLELIVQVSPEPPFAAAVFTALHERLRGPRSLFAAYTGRGPLLAMLSLLTARVAVNTLQLQRPRSAPPSLAN